MASNWLDTVFKFVFVPLLPVTIPVYNPCSCNNHSLIFSYKYSAVSEKEVNIIIFLLSLSLVKERINNQIFDDIRDEYDSIYDEDEMDWLIS